MDRSPVGKSTGNCRRVDRDRLRPRSGDRNGVLRKSGGHSKGKEIRGNISLGSIDFNLKQSKVKSIPSTHKDELEVSTISYSISRDLFPGLIVESGDKANQDKSVLFSNTSKYSSEVHPSLGTPHPRKSIVLNPRNLMRRLQVNLPQEKPIKKVLILSPRTSSSINSDSTTLCDRQSIGLSFEERRRLFHDNEFIIAKNGKKLCDFPHPETIFPTWSRDSLDRKVEKHFESLITAQDLTRLSYNELSGISFGPQKQTLLTSSLCPPKVEGSA